MQYIDNIIQSRVVDNLKLYIEQVRICAIKRLAYQMGEDIKTTVLEAREEQGIEELLGIIQQKTLELVLNNEQTEEVHLMGDGTEEILNQRANNPQTIPGYTLGWKKFDKTTQGYKGNELTVWCALSKTGKSAMLLNHAKKFSVDDKIPGLYIDTEMTDREQEDRLLAIISGVPYEEILNGMFAKDTEYGLSSNKVPALKTALQKIKQSKLYHIYMPNFTIEKVSAMVRKYRIQFNIGYFIFDYIKLPTSEIGGLATAQEYQRLGYITTCLKDLTGICNIPGITAAQANRSNLDGTMDESSIGGSYRILQMATRLIFLRNKTDMELASQGLGRGNQSAKIAFQRNGSSNHDEIDFVYDRPILRMYELSR
jgi:replicative DNA helicase